MTNSHSLKSRAKKSTIIITLGYLISQLLRLGSNLILTRLLVPEMFGLMAIVAVFITGIGMFSDIGLLQNIVQSKNDEKREFLNTAWTIQIIRGLFIFIAAISLSSILFYMNTHDLLPANSVYSEPQLPLLIAIMSISSIIRGFNSINLQLLNRKLLMFKITSIDIISQLTGLSVMIIVAYFWRDVWVLVLAGLITSTVKMLMSHHPSFGPRPKLELSKVYVQEIVRFGKWVFLGSIFAFLLAQGDRIILGGLITPEMLGIYSIAFFLANSVRAGLQKLTSSVFYSALSEVARERPEQLKKVYYQIRKVVDLITMSIAGLMTSAGHILVNFLYDDRYYEAGWMFEILSISIIFVGYSLAGHCLMALGNSKSNFFLTFANVLFLYITVPIFYHFYGLHGAILTIALNYTIYIPLTFFLMRRYQLLDIFKELRMIPIFAITYIIGSILTNYSGL